MLATGCGFLTSTTVRGDPVFECKNTVTDTTFFTNVEGYIECGLDCECSVFEHICLLKRTDNDDVDYYTLEQRSIDFEKTCDSPDCICNSN